MPRTQLCVTVAAATADELRTRRDAAAADADLVELRLDLTGSPDVDAALAERTGPVIVTCRPAREGGGYTGPEGERLQLLARAQQLGAEFIDVEWRSDHQPLLAATGGRGVVLSAHHFAGMPEHLKADVDAMCRTGAEVIKVAVQVERLRDLLQLQEIARQDPRLLAVGMGEAGLPSRVLASRFGARWTYAGQGHAPGQLPATVLRGEYGFDRVTDATAVYGVVGRPVAHSVSPAMHNAAFRAAGLDAVYLPLAAADWDDFAAFAHAFEVEGASVTAPFKADAFALASEHDATSARLQVANTLKRHGRAWHARNTDVEGFLAPLAGRGELRSTRATVLGAGGAARAASLGLAHAGATLTICARDVLKADAVAKLTGAERSAWPPPLGSWDLLVNATPVGTYPDIDRTPLSAELLTGNEVYDLVYNPATTRLLFEAAAQGCRTIGGLDMLVAQAARQFQWWTGLEPDLDAMRTAAVTRLEELRHTGAAQPTQ